MTEKTAPSKWRELAIDGFMGLIGPLSSARQEDGCIVYGLPTSEAHQNAMGLIHGGVISSLVDQATALVAWKAIDRQPLVTIQLDVRFLSAAKAGDFLLARCKIRHSTRTLMFVDAEVECEGKTIATASTIMKISNKAG